MLQDLRFGLRLLERSPIFTATAILLLALGIGATTAIFSLVNALLLRPLPVRHPENLVRLVEVHPNNFLTWDLPYRVCERARDQDPDLAEVLCQGEADLAFALGDRSGRARVHLVSANFFSSLGVSAALGRVLNADDERTRAPVAVLSYGFWRREFTADGSVVGKSIRVGGHVLTIVGISPDWFNGLSADTSPDLRVPASLDRLLLSEQTDDPRPLFAQIFARLRPGVTAEEASARADRLLHRVFDEEMNRLYPKQRGSGVSHSRLRLESITNGVSTLRTQFSRGLELLMAGVALLLLMACANVAGLLLARSAARAPEMSIRRALGASPGRIARQLLTEGLLLGMAGGIMGVLLTFAVLPLFVRALPPIRDRAAVLQPLAVHVSVDGRVLAFALAATVVSAILFTLSPALGSARVDTRSVTSRMAGRNLIVAGQVAICTVILLCAVQLVRTLERMQRMDPGFNPDRVVTFTLDPSLRGYKPDQARAFSKELLERVKQLPGVKGAGMSSRPLMRGTGLKATLGAAGQHLSAGDFLNSSLNSVTPDYFEALAIKLLAGRSFTWFDRSAKPPGRAIVNETFARHFFPGKNPIGERFGPPGPSGVAGGQDEIIGIVSDARYRSLREPVPPTAYSPAVDGFDSDFILYVRTPRNPEAMEEPVRKLVHSLDPAMPLIEVHTLKAEIEASLWQERLLAVLASVFALLAALLAAIGLYGTLDYAVRSRTREIGVRMAVGAGLARIAGLFSRGAARIVVSGLALGLGLYALIASSLRRFLYELRPWDTIALVVTALFVFWIALAAVAPAILRAVYLDPAEALRRE